MNPVQDLLKTQLKQNIPQLRSGQVVRVHERIKEGDPSASSGQAKERTQIFEGLVIAVKHGNGLDGTFTVRKIGVGGVGVERIFPLHMPAIAKIEILRQERVRRAKLYYVRGQIGKKTKKRKAKIQNLIFDMGGDKKEVEEPSDAAEASEQEVAPVKENETSTEKSGPEEKGGEDKKAKDVENKKNEDSNTEASASEGASKVEDEKKNTTDKEEEK